MGKFTPGKWKIDWSSCVSYDCPHTFIYPEDLQVRQIDEDVHIALVRDFLDSKDSYDECSFNARLIAAAPEMYELLRELLLHNDYGLSLQQAKKISSLLSRIDGDSDAEKQESDP